MDAFEETIDLKRFDAIRETLHYLSNRKTYILLEELPNEIKKPFLEFMVGKTIPFIDGKDHFHFTDFMDFYNMLWRR